VALTNLVPREREFRSLQVAWFQTRANWSAGIRDAPLLRVHEPGTPGAFRIAPGRNVRLS